MSGLQITRFGPTAIGSYALKNNTIGANIYPQLRDADDASKVLWDARYDTSGTGHLLLISQERSFSLDVAAAKLKGKKFILSCNSLFSEDRWDLRHIFTYDENSTTTAFAEASGTVNVESLKYLDVVTRDPRAILTVPSRPNAYADETAKVLQMVKDGSIKQRGAPRPFF